MESARYQKNLEEVYAEVLLQRVLDESDILTSEAVEQEQYICLGCCAAMIPAAIRPNMKVSPYFKVRPKVRHSHDCDIEGYEKLAKRCSKRPVSSSAGFPFSYPSKLRLPQCREVIDSNQLPNSLSRISVDSTSTSNTDGIQRKNHHRTVRTIKSLVKHFISFPHEQDRALPLLVPGVAAKTYQDVFQRLNYRVENRYIQTRIYFGRLLCNRVFFGECLFRLPLVEGI